MGPPDGPSAGRGLGLVGGAAGLAASLFLLFGPVVRVTTERSSGETTSYTVSGIDYLLGSPDAQFALFAWPVLMGAVALVGAGAAWRGRRRWTLAAALTLGAFVVVGMFSIGTVYAPAAALLLFDALLGRED
jgi:hypothetical protein